VGISLRIQGDPTSLRRRAAWSPQWIARSSRTLFLGSPAAA